MSLEIMWTYTESTDHLSVDFPKPDFEPDSPIILKLAWGSCKSYFQFHDFFGRRPRSHYAIDSDMLIITFPGYDLMSFEENYPTNILEKQGDINTCLNENTGFVKAIQIKNASKSLLWSHRHQPSDLIDRRNTY